MAMPQPNVTGFAGVLHLHGRLADPWSELGISETDLVLTSAEFGDAYLRSGWASRYVYDLVRACAVVLVGYQADDPPMRYPLEALEADRERYPGLQKVYAFAPCAPGKEKVARALWGAKAVEPILYTASDDDHSSLYATLREWRRYAEDPTAWRHEQLRSLLSNRPRSLPENKIFECAALLGHGDASQLLGELSPEAEWLPVLIEKRVFDNKTTRPGDWIATRANDPQMIRACAGLSYLDQQTRWQINQALRQEAQSLTPVRLKAWQLLLAAKRPQPNSGPGDNWYIAASNIRNNQADFEARRLVVNILRPRLKVGKAVRRPDDAATPDGPETVFQLLRVDFKSAGDPSPANILATWPTNADQEVALFHSLDRCLMEALEEAEDAGFLSGFDRASHDVPSVALHGQNTYRTGFYPITRTIADLWLRVLAQKRDQARVLSQAWAVSRFLLVKRLWLFTLRFDAFTPDEAAAGILNLDHHLFWVTEAQVEIMRVLADRWMDFNPTDRSILETRLREGTPRDLFPLNSFEKEDEWRAIHDSSIFKRLKRIEAMGGTLAPESQTLLAEITARHPKWRAGPGDRDDFHSWHEIRSGPSGHAELLDGIADDGLVKEAMRLQREQFFEEADIWRVFCSADPDRALRGLRFEADNAQWDVEPWRCLLWTATENAEPAFQFELADLLARMPDRTLQELLPSATSWLQRRREVLSATERPGGPRFLHLWDRFADLTYHEHELEDSDAKNKDLLNQSLASPGGILAWVLIESLSALSPIAGSGLGQDLKPRFDRIAIARGHPGLLARVCLAHHMAFLDAIDPTWTEERLSTLFSWERTEAPAVWRAYSQGGSIGSARLFNTVKPAMLEAFRRTDLSDHEFEGLISKMLTIGLSHQRGEAHDYNLTTAEIKEALTVGPPVVRWNASRSFWQIMSEEQGEHEDRATRWREIVGPLLREIWPLDAELRSEDTARNLVLMALECEAAFPESVDAIVDFIVPYQLHLLSSSLRLEQKHDHLVREHPIAFVRLVNALIEPTSYPVPDDLGALLQECLGANSAVAIDPAYIRLYGLRRQRNA
jgi:hypothetical protein